MSRSASIMDWGRAKNVNTSCWFANTGIVEHVYMCTCTCRLFSSFSLNVQAKGCVVYHTVY